MKLKVAVPRIDRQVRAAGEQYRRDLRAAAVIATDRASKEAQRAVQERIRSVGLGRLAGAVGQTSERREKGGRDPYGVIFARGGDESLAGGALESYSRGATIVAQQGQWLAFATKAIPRFVTVGGRRFRTTPQLYRASALNTSIGQLVFKPIGPNRAILVIRKVNVSPKTGRAKAPGARRSRTLVAQKEVVAFVLIRVTRRGQRFDKDAIVRMKARQLPDFLRESLDAIRRGRA